MSANNYTRISNGMYTLISGVKAEFETEQDEAIANLRTAIITRAIDEYIDAQAELVKMVYPETERIDEAYMKTLTKGTRLIETIADVERFIKSNYFSILVCGAVSSEDVLQVIRQRAKETGYTEPSKVKALYKYLNEEKKRVTASQAKFNVQDKPLDVTDVQAVRLRLEKLDRTIALMQQSRPRGNAAKVQNYYDDLELLINERKYLLTAYKKLKGIGKKKKGAKK